MVIENNKCAVCEAEYGSGSSLVNDVCGDCRKLYPGAKTKEDLHKDKTPEVENRETIIKGTVIKQVNELLETYGILHRCLDCGSLYFRRSPAQKSCGCQKEAK